MPIPDFQSLMLPLLRFTSDGREHTLREAEDALALEFNLNAAEKAELLPSGRQAIFSNRIGWARLHIKKAGLVEQPRRGYFNITSRGYEVLKNPPEKINLKYLDQFPEHVEFRNSSRNDNVEKVIVSQPAQEQTPEESLETAFQTLRRELAQDILSRVLSCSPAFFEQLVVELLVKMGYGGSRRDAGERIGQSGDGGIDGIIKEDRLGLDTIYLQAKRWQGSVGRPEIQKFVGALEGQRARKGVFLTTSTFTAEATNYVSNIDKKVVLIDGEMLANLMIDFDVGVSISTTYTLKRMDSDYFDDSF
ncbi:MAG: restriction endonuclease [Halothiobacillaceae bacterium]